MNPPEIIPRVNEKKYGPGLPFAHSESLPPLLLSSLILILKFGFVPIPLFFCVGERSWLLFFSLLSPARTLNCISFLDVVLGLSGILSATAPHAVRNLATFVPFFWSGSGASVPGCFSVQVLISPKEYVKEYKI